MRRGVMVQDSWTSPTTSSISVQSDAKKKSKNSMTRPTCEIRRCKRDASRLTLKGGRGTRVIAHICTFHWNLVSFLTAPRRVSALWTHRLKTMQVGNLVLFALHKG